MSSDRPKTPMRVHLFRGLIITPIVLFVVAVLLMKFNAFHRPYPPAGKQFAWLLGMQEEGYNFGVIEAGKAYRSARPDEKQ